jgi:outer membrane protein insertion porin family
MHFLRLGGRASWLACAVAIGVVLAPAAARAVGEEITDVRVVGNQRTDEATVRSIAGVSIGDTLETDTLDTIRERLNTRGLFADVNVWWEANGVGVRIVIQVKDKFPWAPVPTGSWSANNKALGVVFVHGNLFGRGKQLLLGARIATVDSGAVVAYRDPALFGSWIYWQVQAVFERKNVPEYDPDDQSARAGAFRNTILQSYGWEPAVGIAWFRRVKTQVAWKYEDYTAVKSYLPSDPEQTPIADQATKGARIGFGRAQLNFDFRSREFAVMTGTSLAGTIDVAGGAFRGDVDWWRVGGGFEHGVKFFKSHNLVYAASGSVGYNLPFWNEATAGGPNLRGYLYQQFRGDTQASAKIEYHFPLFSVGSLDFRALAFYDASAVWFRNLPDTPDPSINSFVVRNTPDARSYYVGPNGLQKGFDFTRDIHQDVGGGFRFFLRSVAVPLVGFDAGYGLEAHTWRFLLIVGA